MISRIQEIKNIGTFLHTRPASIELSKLVLLYGSNSQGKTTICDIIKSLKNNDPTLITQRKTVGQTEQPIVSFNFSNGKNAKYQNGTWSIDSCLTEIPKIEIFDTAFVFDNVFTNNIIEHKNKENFTRFIIGEKSINLSKKLLDLNNEKIEYTRQLDAIKNEVEKSLKNIISLNDFLKIPFQEDVNDEDVACLGIKTTIQEEENNRKNISAIKSLNFPIELPLVNLDMYKMMNDLNEIFKSSYTFQKQDLIELYNKHKKEYINSNNSAEIDNWILQGTQWVVDNRCPFCGSSLNENNIFDVFLEIFSKDIQEYNKRVSALTRTKLALKITNNLPQIIKNEDLLDKIKSKVFDDKVTILYQKLLELKETIVKSHESSELELKKLIEIFEEKIKDKLNNFYSALEAVDLSAFYNSIETYNKHIQNYNSLLQDFNTVSGEYIQKLTVETINQHIAELEKEYDRLFLIVERNNLDDKISTYISLKEKINDNLILAKQIKNDFDLEQESYLTNFYEDINNYFEKFGSKNYKIEKEITTRGTNKTYSLNVYYRGELVPKDKIQYVLSESDRRALALAIFFTKIKKTADSDTIIFLDDPITSFDIDRMNIFINEIKRLKDSIAQIIITTHYQNFYKKAVQLTSFDNPTLIKIIHGPISNDLKKIDIQEEPLLMDDYQSAIHSLITFMEGSSHSYSEVDARTLMQKYLEYHFAYEIRTSNFKFTQLHELLQWLKDTGYLDETLFKELDLKREEYNSPAHQFDNDEEEQKRNSIIDLYSILQKV